MFRVSCNRVIILYTSSKNVKIFHNFLKNYGKYVHFLLLKEQYVSNIQSINVLLTNFITKIVL